MLSGTREPDSITQEERDMVQALITETYGKFKGVVATGRKQAQAKNKDKGRALTEDWANYADGRILSGTEAFKPGFVDELGTFEDAVKRTKKIANIEKANLIEEKQSERISDLFRLFGQSEGKAGKVDWAWKSASSRPGPAHLLSPTILHDGERCYRRLSTPWCSII